MRQGFLFLAISIGMVCGTVWATGGDMGKGTEPLTDGSETYPYLIEDLADFDTFANPANAAAYWAAGVHTKLMTDMDLSGRTYTTAVIAPDMSSDFGFQGTFYSGLFDGNELTISNLTIVIASVGNYHALFGKVGEATASIENLNIENMSVTNGSTSDYIGGLVGLNDSGGITNCSWNGTIKGGHIIGGLVGQNYGSIENCHTIDVNIQSYAIAGGLAGTNYGIIRNCCTTGEVIAEKDVGGLTGTSESTPDTIIESCSSSCVVRYIGTQTLYSAGGLVGSNFSDITGCYATGDVSGNNYVGGLAGKNYGAIQRSFSMGSVVGSSSVGGIVGNNYSSGHITMCYSQGNISSQGIAGSAGGIVGSTGGAGLISHCYAVGLISGTGSVGGIMGVEHNYANYETCFWDITKNSSLQDSGSRGEIANIFAENTANLKLQSTFAGWDFVNDWMLLREGEDYPRLAWQEVFDGDIAGLYGADMVDFAYLASYWGLDVDGCGRADIDNSGDVGITDLTIVAGDWLRGID